MAYGRFNERKVAPDFLYAPAYLHLHAVTGRHGIAVFHFKAYRHSGSLKFAVYYPASDFIHKGGLNASMQGLQPTLIIVGGIPEADKVVPVLIELHLKTARILRTACKTIVALLLKTYIGILYLFHDTTLLGCLQTLRILGNLELVKHILNITVHEDRQIVHRVIYAVVSDT